MKRFKLSGIAQSFLKEDKQTYKFALGGYDNDEFSDSDKKKHYNRFIDNIVERFYDIRKEDGNFNTKITDFELEDIIMDYAERDLDTFTPEFLQANKKVLQMIVKDIRNSIPNDPFEVDDEYRQERGY